MSTSTTKLLKMVRLGNGGAHYEVFHTNADNDSDDDDNDNNNKDM